MKYLPGRSSDPVRDPGNQAGDQAWVWRIVNTVSHTMIPIPAWNFHIPPDQEKFQAVRLSWQQKSSLSFEEDSIMGERGKTG